MLYHHYRVTRKKHSNQEDKRRLNSKEKKGTMGKKKKTGERRMYMPSIIRAVCIMYGFVCYYRFITYVSKGEPARSNSMPAPPHILRCPTDRAPQNHPAAPPPSPLQRRYCGWWWWWEGGGVYGLKAVCGMDFHFSLQKQLRLYLENNTADMMDEHHHPPPRFCYL